MTEVKIDYFQSVTQNVNGLATTKNLLFEDLKDIKELYEKQEKQLKKFKKDMFKLEESQQSLQISIEEKKKSEVAKKESNDGEIHGFQLKITELTDLNKQYESQYKKNTYKITNSIFTLEKKVQQQKGVLNDLNTEKDELAQKLNELVTKAQKEKADARDVFDQVNSKIYDVRRSIAQQEQEDQEEEFVLQQFKALIADESLQEISLKDQLNKNKQQNILKLKTEITHIEENMAIVQGNIDTLNRAISEQKNFNSNLQVQLKEITTKINLEINIIVQQKEQLDRQTSNFEKDAANQMSQFDFQFNQITNEKSQYLSHLQKLKSSEQFNQEQIQDYKNQILIFEEQQKSQRSKLQIELEELTNKEQRLKDQFEQEKKQLKDAQDKLIIRYSEFSRNYEQHCTEILTLRSSYEQTIVNVNIKINESKTIIHNYEVEIQQHQAIADDYRPAYYIQQGNKGPYKPEESVQGEQEDDDDDEEEDEDSDVSESDDEHYNMMVHVLTKGEIKASKKKIKIEIVNGTYYLIYGGYIRKVEKDHNIMTDSRKNRDKNYNFSYKMKLFDEIDQTTLERLAIKGMKVHRMKIQKKKGTTFSLKVSKVPSGTVHQAVGQNQQFYGTYESNGRTVPMALKNINVDENGRMYGKCSDCEGGDFTIEGVFNTKLNTVQFVKQYTNPALKDPIKYNGTYANKTIKGRWSCGLYNNPFEMTTTQKVHQFSGWYDQNGQQSPMNFILFNKKGNEVGGEGTDDDGAYKWKGKIEENGQVQLQKQYLHALNPENYKGLKKGNKITGIWTEGNMSGNFEFLEQDL